MPLVGADDWKFSLCMIKFSDGFSGMVIVADDVSGVALLVYVTVGLAVEAVGAVGTERYNVVQHSRSKMNGIIIHVVQRDGQYLKEAAETIMIVMIMSSQNIIVMALDVAVGVSRFSVVGLKWLFALMFVMWSSRVESSMMLCLLDVRDELKCEIWFLRMVMFAIGPIDSWSSDVASENDLNNCSLVMAEKDLEEIF